jgi:adenylate cyclase
MDDSNGFLDRLRGWMLAAGCSAREIDTAVDQGPVQAMTLLQTRRIRPGARLSPAELRDRIGVDAAAFEEIRRAASIPPSSDDDLVYADGDVALFEMFGRAEELFSRAEVLQFTRVLGSSLARLAEAANSLFLVDVETPHLAGGGAPEDLVRKGQQAVALLDGVVRSMDGLFRLHMDLAVSRSRQARVDRDDGLAELAVGFVDLVGFTRWSAVAEPGDLDRLVREFERQAYDLTADHDARVVKLMGDEVMFVAVDPAAACAAGQALVEGFTAAGAVPRGGLAFGPMLARGGDYYGPVVNLASRIADQAVPGELLVTPELAARVPAGSFEPAGRRVLKGFDAPVTLLSLVGSVATADH